ncbi:hypothetical protein PAMP_010025 [Pampus punctatissimus]
MGLPVTIKVNFRGNVKRFLAQDLDKLEWDSVEAWIKASFGINHFQVKYFDEDNEESAEKQGNQLHMNVYKMKGQACGGPLKTEVKELKGDLRPAPPYPSRVKTVDKGTQVTPEREAVIVKDSKGSKPEDEPPPMWFRSYMEKFKDEVVKEVVERMCNDFSGQCCTHKSPDGPSEASGASGGPIGPKPGPSTSNGSLGYTPNCSSCNKPTSEGAYKCRSQPCPPLLLQKQPQVQPQPKVPSLPRPLIPRPPVQTSVHVGKPRPGVRGEEEGGAGPLAAARTSGRGQRGFCRSCDGGDVHLPLAAGALRVSVRPACLKEQRPVEKEKEIRSNDCYTGLSVDLHDDYYFPSVDLLTAQDLLSFELLDINIVQELEKVPNNTPVDLTPCISPLPHDSPVLEKLAVTSQIKDDTEVTGVRKPFGVKLRHQRELLEPVALEEEREEEISGAQFLCETVIRSLTLEEAPDHRPLRRAQHSSFKPQVVSRGPSFFLERVVTTEKTELVQEGNEEICGVRVESLAPPPNTGLNQISQEEETQQAPPLSEIENLHVSSHHDNEDEEVVVLEDIQNLNTDTHEEKDDGTKGEDWDEVSSQTSSVSSCDDYIIVLPDCFDTSRPLGESMYSSAMSQPDCAVAVTSADPDEQQEVDEDSRAASPIEKQEQTEVAAAENTSVNTWPPPVPPIHSSVNQMLCASQTLDAVTLTPEVVPPPPVLPDPLLSPPALYSPRSEALYLAEEPSPPAGDTYEPHQPRVHLNARHRPSRQAGPFPDGDAAGDGLQRPAAQPAAAEEARLQPAAHRQRAGADGRGQPEQSCQHSALRDRKLRESYHWTGECVTRLHQDTTTKRQRVLILIRQKMEKVKTLKQFPPYGAINGNSGHSCPTCHGTGRIPRGHQDQLVAVIPCNDIRLKPRRTKLYVCISMALCLFLCCLILFFLFPRSVTLTPVSVLSVMVHFTPDTVDMEVTNLINITNENFSPVQIVELNVQGLVSDTVVGKTKISNMTSLKSRSQRSYTIQIDLPITDKGLNSYCKSSSIKIHTLFLELQMTMNISYLAHTEQVSLNTFEYIDCGTNSTIPHPV